MRFERAYIPLGHAWSSPFVRWQGALADVNSLDLAQIVTARALDERGIEPREVSELVLGWTVPQSGGFYGAPTLAARLGASHATGPMFSQACATSAACVQYAAAAVENTADPDRLELVVATDRTSNGPLLVFPQSSGMGGAPQTETWVLENFRRDPWAGKPMIEAAELVAAEGGYSRDEVDALALLRYEQYQAGLADGASFQRGYLVPVELPRRKGAPTVIGADQGVYETTKEGLASLEPVQDGGVITFGAQTHPADGCAGLVVTTRARARAMSDGGVAQILGVGTARVEAARMPRAPVPAAFAALDAAGIDISEVDAVTTHNPFAVNDLWLSTHTGLPVESMNDYGSSLVYGHPQAPTGLRLIAELLETLRRRGGGVGLFTGCAAGDTAMAVVVRVAD